MATPNCPQVRGKVFVQGPPSYCVASAPYAITVPADNLFVHIGLNVPAGIYQAINEGVYLLLAPPSAGRHTIHFATPSMDLTYRLTVAP